MCLSVRVLKFLNGPSIFEGALFAYINRIYRFKEGWFARYDAFLLYARGVQPRSVMNRPNRDAHTPTFGTSRERLLASVPHRRGD